MMHTSRLLQRRSGIALSTSGRWPLANLFLGAGLILLGIIYLLAVNDLSTKVYEVRSLRNRLSSVSEQTNRVKRETVQGQSRTQLTEAIRAYPFVPEGSLEYARSSSVAFEAHARP